ncbi:MAG: ABC transporter permease [Clostridiales bacterium]|nr:ABC transporter permease [Clostridiales bacterium]
MRKYHLVRRADAKLKRTLLYYAIGILASLLIGAVILAVLGVNPLEYFGKMFTIGLVGNKYGYRQIEGLLKNFVPLLITSVALSLSFKMRFWNIGGEGEFLAGAIAAAIVAFQVTGLPNFVTVLLMCLAAMISSGLIGVAVAALKVKFNTNETLMTLMINYIMLYVIKYIGETKADWNFFLQEESDRPIFGTFPESAFMGRIPIGKFSLLWSVIIAVVLTVIIYVYLKYTKHGYEISVVGDSSATAKYAGMSVGKIVLRTMFISSALIGLAAALAVSSAGTISDTITNDVGWTGIIVAWLSKLNIPAVFVTSFLIEVLQYGCQIAASQYPAIDSNYANLLQGIILFSVLVADFVANFRVVRKEDAKNA